MGDPLLDKDFLRELDLNRNKVIYARLTSLDFDENPIEYIEGRITGGSINIDGTSVVRRTCNLTLISEEININDFYWGLNTKVNVEIGIQNIINPDYPNIIWFKQGIYVITTFNTSIGTNQATISISGKDKGCMLNGDVAGNLPSSVDFGTIEELETTYEPITLQEKTYRAYEYYLYEQKTRQIPDPEHPGQTIPQTYYEYVLDSGYPNGFDEEKQYYQKYTTSSRTKLKLNDIIREAVHIYGKEPYHNIVINDLEDYGLELLQYSGEESIYMLRSVSDNQTTGSGNFEHISLDGEKEYYIRQNDNIVDSNHQLKYFKNNNPDAVQDSRIDDWNNSATTVYFQTKTKEKDNQGNIHIVNGYTKPYTVAVVSTGETAGYRMTDLVYNGDLISNIGETLTSMLDKIKNMLGDFEYFYNIEGHFIFQRKKTFVNTSWNSIITSNDERFALSLAETSSSTYSFEGNVLLTAVQQSPVLNNLKNDYSIWGNRKSISGADIPIHLRYAIHKKPNYYRAFDGKVYCTDAEYARQVLTKTYATLVTKYRTPLSDFQMQYANEMPPNLIKPEQKANGLWTAGWWDIRDWAAYYKLVMDTDEDPKYTMKWYSFNSVEGCVPIASLNVDNIPQWWRSSYCWLVVVTTYTNNDGSKRYVWNFAHGSGQPTNYTKHCSQYQSYYDPNNPSKLITEKTGVEDDFIAPFSGCDDRHTYLHFLEQDITENTKVYFYNPRFPGIDNIEQFIEQQVIEEYEEFIDESLINVVDWREIIYQMAVDYYRYNTTPKDEKTQDLYIEKGWDLEKTGENFLYNLIINNKLGDGDYLYPNGYTGYEQYYPDMQGFWRQLYCPLYDDQKLNIRYTMSDGDYQVVRHYIDNTENYTQNNSEYVQPSVQSFTCDFYLPAEYIKTIDADIEARGYRNDDKAVTYRDTRPKLDEYGHLQYNNDGTVKTEQCTIKGWSSVDAAADCKYKSYFNDDYAGWARNVIDNPAALNFWIDFLDTGELGQFDVTTIGDRQKVVNDKDVTCIYNKEVPDIIFVDPKEDFSLIDRKTGYTYCKLNSALENLFSISAMGKSAKEQLDALLYQYAYCIENVTLTSIPIYYLEPNTRVFVHDEKTKIDGDYIVTKFTLPLNTNGTMSITANKAPQRIY